jgi:hypothetical protein
MNKIISESKFTKHFELNDIQLFIHKAYDEDSDKHFITPCIPFIEELNIHDLKDALVFDNEVERDVAFDNWDVDFAKYYIEFTIEKIKKQNAENEKNKQ